MLQTRRKKIAFAALVVLAAGIYMEWTGYGDFDSRGGENIVCRLDPSCRSLSDAEIARAREIFGDVLDYSRIKIFERPSYATIPAKLLLGFEGIAETPNGNVYYQDHSRYSADMTSDPEKLSILLHEITHAWQFQTRSHLLLSAIREYMQAGYNYKALYDYDINDETPFGQLGIEQQASVIEAYQVLSSSFQAVSDRAKWRQDHCHDVLRYETKLRQALPVQSLAGCGAQD